MFYDCKMNEQTKYKIHHFRSSNINEEVRFLNLYWEQCLSEPQCIPARQIRDVGSTGMTSKIQTLNTIAFFDNSMEIESNQLNTKTTTTTTTNIIIDKRNLPPYQPKAQYICQQKEHNEECNTTTHSESNIIMAPLTSHEIYSLKPIKEDILENIKSNLNFKSKTAMYIQQIIPKEKVLVKKYDNVRMKLKTIKNHETLHEELLNISAEIEVKLLLKNDDLKAE